jgi:hypothetical protein
MGDEASRVPHGAAQKAFCSRAKPYVDVHVSQAAVTAITGCWSSIACNQPTGDRLGDE